MFKKTLALFLVVAVLALSLPFSMIASATTLPSEVADKGFTVGNTLFDTDFTSATSMPEGWSIPTNAELTGFSGWVPNNSVSHEFTADGLKITSSGCDGNIFSPYVNTANYVYELTLISAGVGSHGSIINVKTSGASRFVSYTTTSGGNLAGKAHYYNKYTGNGISEGTNHILSDYGIATPANGTVLTFKSYVFNDTAYCYLNGTYLFSYEVEGNQTSQRLGAFFCNNTITIVSASAKALNAVGGNVYEEEVVLPDGFSGYELGETIFEGFTDYDLGTLPEGWVSVAGGAPNGNNVGWGADGSSLGDIGIVENNGAKMLHVVSYGCDTYILAPSVAAENYIYQATLISNSNNFIGITNNSWGDTPADITSVQWLAVGESQKADPDYWKSYGANGQNAESISDAALNIRYTTGAPITLTLISANGVNFYYINNKLVATANQSTSNVDKGSDRVGFYGYHADFYVQSAVVKALNAVESDLPEGVGMAGESLFLYGDVIYENDFENETVGTLPEGWSYGWPYGTNTTNTSYGWAANSSATASAQVVEHGNLGKVVQFGSAATDAFMALPSTGTMNYVYEATVVVNTNGNSIGLANNFYASTDKAGGVMYTSIYPNSSAKALYQYRGNGTGGEWKVSYNPQNGETLKLKIVSLNGFNYIYYNGTHVATAAWRGGAGSSDNPGFYTYNGNAYITDVKVTEAHTAYLSYDNMSIKVNKDETVDTVLEFSFDKTQDVFTKYFSGDYSFSEDSDLKLGFIRTVGSENTAANLKVEDVEQIYYFSDDEITQDAETLVATCVDTAPDSLWNSWINVRPVVDVGGMYFYGDGKAYTVANLANGTYMSAATDEEKALIEKVFAENGGLVVGSNAKELTFTVFADFHYKAGMYSTSMADLREILKRADDSNSAFVVSAGDMTNDMLGSPELVNTFLGYKTSEGDTLKAYNVYGNHELESTNNSMEVVTPTLTNDVNVVWGDGTIGHDPEDLTIAYYYVDVDGFRMVFVDNQFSWNPNHIDGVVVGWEHSLTCSYGPPLAADNATRGFDEGAQAVANTNSSSLGPVQMAWLEEVLLDAAAKDIPCIVTGHAGYSGLGFGGGSSDAAQVREVYAKANAANPGTVIMSINGHIHTNNQGWNEGVFYFDVNTVRNNWWQSQGSNHYGPEHTYMFEEYDAQGNLLGITEKSLGTLGMAAQTWFSEDPLSAVVTVNDAGVITIDGKESRWAYGIAPPNPNALPGGTECRITSGVFWNCGLYGHIETYSEIGEGHTVACKTAGCDYKGKFVTAHNYDGNCDGDCNDCGAVRDVTGHEYDNDADTTCNNCGAVTYPGGNTLVQEDGIWYHVINREKVKDTTLVKYNNEWFYVKDGVLNRSNTLHKYTDGKWYHVNNGKWVKDTTLVQYNGTWYYVNAGRVDFNSTTLVKYNNEWWYVKGGKLNRDNTLVKYNNQWYHVNGGKWVKDTTLVKYNGTWYYVKDGRVSFSSTTLTQYNGTWYYVNAGRVDFNSTTLVKYNNEWWYVKGGKLNRDNTLVKYNNQWYHVNGGKWVKDTTLVKYNGTWYYVSGGRVNFNYTGSVLYNGKTYKVVKGKLA